MAVSVTVLSLKKNATTGRIYLTFTDGTQMEFNDIAAAHTYVDELDAPAGEGLSNARRLMVRWLLARDAAGSNPAAAVGKRLTLDLSGATPIVVDQT